MSEDEIMNSEENGEEEVRVGPPALPEAVARTPWGGWWTLLWGVCALLMWQVGQSVGLFGMAWREFMDLIRVSEGVIDEEGLMAVLMDAEAVAMAALLGAAVVVPICWMFGKVKEGWGGWEYLGFERVVWWKGLLWVLAILLLVGLIGLVGPALGLPEKTEFSEGLAETVDVPILLFLGLAVGASVAEEFIFRGLLWRGWRATRLGFWGTCLLTSGFWAVLHVQYGPGLIGVIFVMGILIGWAREKTGGLWVPMAMHTANNAMATLALLGVFGE